MNIVILDDSFTIRLTIEALLEDLSVQPEEMNSFSNGADALEYIKNNLENIDLIFSDIHMPVMTGYEFAEEVFKLKKSLQSVFFAISGDETKTSYRKMKEVGVHRFINKPIDSNHFNHFVEQEVKKHHHIKNSKGKK